MEDVCVTVFLFLNFKNDILLYVKNFILLLNRVIAQRLITYRFQFIKIFCVRDDSL